MTSQRIDQNPEKRQTPSSEENGRKKERATFLAEWFFLPHGTGVNSLWVGRLSVSEWQESDGAG